MRLNVPSQNLLNNSNDIPAVPDDTGRQPRTQIFFKLFMVLEKVKKEKGQHGKTEDNVKGGRDGGKRPEQYVTYGIADGRGAAGEGISYLLLGVRGQGGDNALEPLLYPIDSLTQEKGGVLDKGYRGIDDGAYQQIKKSSHQADKQDKHYNNGQESPEGQPPMAGRELLFQPVDQRHQEIRQDQADDKGKQKAPYQVHQPDKSDDTQHQGYQAPVPMPIIRQWILRSNGLTPNIWEKGISRNRKAGRGQSPLLHIDLTDPSLSPLP